MKHDATEIPARFKGYNPGTFEQVSNPVHKERKRPTFVATNSLEQNAHPWRSRLTQRNIASCDQHDEDYVGFFETNSQCDTTSNMKHDKHAITLVLRDDLLNQQTFLPLPMSIAGSKANPSALSTSPGTQCTQCRAMMCRIPYNKLLLQFTCPPSAHIYLQSKLDSYSRKRLTNVRLNAST